MAKASVFKMVGVGVVANNKAIMERVIEITPTEWLPMHDGEMASNGAKMTHKAKDIDGNESQGMILTDQIIKATWMPSGSNRLSPPDVRRGVHVEIWATADADKYYWKTMGLDDHLHKLETIIIGISNTTDESVTELTPENMYWIEFSTHSKRLAFCTSKSNGESYQHELYVDTDAGEFMYTDDIGNLINVQSKVNLIHLQNAKGTFVKVDQKDIKMFAPQDLLVDIKRDIDVKAGRNIKMVAQNDIDVEAKKNLRTKGGILASIDGGGSKMTLTASGTTLKTPKFTGSR
jgi:hypothetical protein